MCDVWCTYSMDVSLCVYVGMEACMYVRERASFEDRPEPVRI